MIQTEIAGNPINWTICKVVRITIVIVVETFLKSCKKIKILTDTAINNPAAAKFNTLITKIIFGKSLSSTSFFGASAVAFILLKIDPATLSVVVGARAVFFEDGAGSFKSKVPGSDTGFGAGGAWVRAAEALPSSQLGVSPSIFSLVASCD
jgi:hypothetical protein